MYNVLAVKASIRNCYHALPKSYTGPEQGIDRCLFLQYKMQPDPASMDIAIVGRLSKFSPKDF